MKQTGQPVQWFCMSKEEELYEHILMRRPDANVSFDYYAPCRGISGLKSESKAIITFLAGLGSRRF